MKSTFIALLAFAFAALFTANTTAQTASALGGATVTQLIAAATLTGTTNGTAVDVSPYIGTGLVILESGSSGTMTMTLQTSTTGTSAWSTVAGGNIYTTGTAVVSSDDAISTAMKVNLDNCSKYIRVLAVTTGTQAGSATLVGMKQSR